MSDLEQTDPIPSEEALRREFSILAKQTETLVEQAQTILGDEDSFEQENLRIIRTPQGTTLVELSGVSKGGVGNGGIVLTNSPQTFMAAARLGVNTPSALIIGQSMDDETLPYAREAFRQTGGHEERSGIDTTFYFDTYGNSAATVAIAPGEIRNKPTPFTPTKLEIVGMALQSLGGALNSARNQNTPKS